MALVFNNLIISLHIFLHFVHIIIRPTFCYQYYDKSNCASQSQFPGSNYICNSQRYPCDAFILYRVQSAHQSLSSISSLFNIKNVSDLLPCNNISEADYNSLLPGRQIIIPVKCFCPHRYSQSYITFNATPYDSLSSIACDIFQGLVKAQTLIDQNPKFGTDDRPKNYSVQVPIRCACPESSDTSNGIKYLVTYPIIGHDSVDMIAHKFGVDQQMIRDANEFETFTTIFPMTTLIVPLKDVPRLNLDATFSTQHPNYTQQLTPVSIIHGAEHRKTNLIVFIGGAVFASTVLLLVACTVLMVLKKNNCLSFRALTSTSSQSTKFPPDFLDGLTKLQPSLVCYSLEEVRAATEEFSEESLIGSVVYRGRFGDAYLAVEEMSSMNEANHVVHILTKTNHLNVVKLVGWCYGAKPLLLYEFAENYSLRNCLSNPKLSKQFSWTKRKQIAFDIAVGIHYIHYCTKPNYVHRNVSSRSVIVTEDWRAKISGFRLAKPVTLNGDMGENECNESEVVGAEGYMAPEYLKGGRVSSKLDIYAIGVVLLELLSAREAIAEGILLKDSVNFLVDGECEDSPGYLDKFKVFMDPCLGGDYQVGDAIGLALLAKACLEEEPLHRPTMNDILKALSRML